MPPTKLAIATNVVNRLLSEERSYHAELASQQSAVAALEARIAASASGAGGGDAAAAKEEQDDAEEREYELRQLRRAVEETRKVIPEVRKRLGGAVEGLRGVIDQIGDGADGGEKNKAEEAVKKAEGVLADKET